VSNEIVIPTIEEVISRTKREFDSRLRKYEFYNRFYTERFIGIGTGGVPVYIKCPHVKKVRNKVKFVKKISKKYPDSNILHLINVVTCEPSCKSCKVRNYIQISDVLYEIIDELVFDYYTVDDFEDVDRAIADIASEYVDEIYEIVSSEYSKENIIKTLSSDR
jgi:hypothetical protein